MSNEALEVNFDGLVGPTHNYSGLAYGNIASMQHSHSLSYPKKAALEGLEKMKLLSSLGLIQGVLPPHERPHIETLRLLGFEGNEKSLLEKVLKEAPLLLYAVSSAASMWTANAATVSSSFDSSDGLSHFIPANLVSKFHRSIERDFTGRILKKIFFNSRYFQHHSPLPACSELSDEGAANHTRLCMEHSQPGIHLFVYGRQAWKQRSDTPRIFPARQTLEASQVVARLLKIPEHRLIFAQQNPKAIDAGVFHNDVASVGYKNIFLFHELAFLDSSQVIQTIQKKFPDLIPIKISNKQIPLKTAVTSYFFNSQLVALNARDIALIAPIECFQNPEVKTQLEELIADDGNPIKKVIYVNLKESMQNGGGPACLRLRIVLSPTELEAIHPGIFLTETLYEKLKQWILKHYRDTLRPEDLADPCLLDEQRCALDKLTQILDLGSIYPFQTV